MFGIHPIAAAPFSDIGFSGVQLSAPAFSTQAPTVATTSISQDHSITLAYNGSPAEVNNLTMFEDETFSAPDVFTGTVRIDAAVFIQGQLLIADDVNSQNPDIGSSTISQDHSLSATTFDTQPVDVGASRAAIHYTVSGNNVDSGSVSIEIADLDEFHIFTGEGVTSSAISISTANLNQTHNLQATFTSGIPEVGQARFPFMEISVDSEIWTETTDTPSEIWTEAA